MAVMKNPLTALDSTKIAFFVCGSTRGLLDFLRLNRMAYTLNDYTPPRLSIDCRFREGYRTRVYSRCTVRRENPARVY